MAVAGMVAIKCVASTNAVGRLEPSSFATEEAENPVPTKVTFTLADPTVALLGDIEMRVGDALVTAVVGGYPDAGSG
jgi:hypothetical protein